MIRAFEARIRAMRQSAGYLRQDLREDGLSETVGMILYRNIVDDQTRLEQVTRGIDPYREVLKALRKRAA